MCKGQLTVYCKIRNNTDKDNSFSFLLFQTLWHKLNNDCTKAKNVY